MLQDDRRVMVLRVPSNHGERFEEVKRTMSEVVSFGCMLHCRDDEQAAGGP